MFVYATHYSSEESSSPGSMLNFPFGKCSKHFYEKYYTPYHVGMYITIVRMHIANI